MSKIVAKFRVAAITDYRNGYGYHEIVLDAVTNGSPENEQFWKSTPNGQIKIGVNNPETVKAFEDMNECYVTFERVD